VSFKGVPRCLLKVSLGVVLLGVFKGVSLGVFKDRKSQKESLLAVF